MGTVKTPHQSKKNHVPYMAPTKTDAKSLPNIMGKK